MHLATQERFAVADHLDHSWNLQANPGAKDLRVALAAQRDRVVAFSLSAVAAVLANLMDVLEINYPACLSLLATGMLSALFFHHAAKRSYRKTGRVRLVGWWLAFDIAIITAMVPLTGGISSPWWIWYLTCAGTAALLRGRRSVVVVSCGIATIYVAILVVQGDIRGLDHSLFLAVSRLVFLAGASAALLLNKIKLRETGEVLRELRHGAEVRADELLRLNSELQDMANLLRDLTLTDALTGLRNRRYVNERIADAAARSGPHGGRERRVARANHSSSGFLMLDLDNFKTINDLCGHEAGDRALKHVAEVLRRSTREDDVIARWGGDEFVVLVPHVNIEQLGYLNETKITPFGGPSGTTSHLNGVVGAAQGGVLEPARAEALEFLFDQGGTYDHFGYLGTGGNPVPPYISSPIRPQMMKIVDFFNTRRFDLTPKLTEYQTMNMNSQDASWNSWFDPGVNDLWQVDKGARREWAALTTRVGVTTTALLFYVHHSTPRCKSGFDYFGTPPLCQYIPPSGIPKRGEFGTTLPFVGTATQTVTCPGACVIVSPSYGYDLLLRIVRH